VSRVKRSAQLFTDRLRPRTSPTHNSHNDCTPVIQQARPDGNWRFESAKSWPDRQYAENPQSINVGTDRYRTREPGTFENVEIRDCRGTDDRIPICGSCQDGSSIGTGVPSHSSQSTLQRNIGHLPGFLIRSGVSTHSYFCSGCNVHKYDFSQGNYAEENR
jgi:hypothetical protein